MASFGIDFGTTNSVLASISGGEVSTVSLDEPPQEWAELGFDRVLPTVLAERNGVIEFGWRAKANPNKLEAVKRMFASDEDVRLGGRSMKTEEAAAIFFKQIKARGAAAGLTVDQAVVTVPANSRGQARARTKISAGLAGIEVLALLNEPTAAAMAYSRHIEDNQLVLVFDFGGGTLDVTILRSTAGVFIEEASKGVGRLGGVDIDAAFRPIVMSQIPSGSMLDTRDLERAKVLLSAHETVAMPLIGGGVVELSRGAFEDAIRPLIVQCGAPIEQCLADMDHPRIEHLVLVGGSSKIPAVQRFVREMVRLDPMVGVDPMTAIAEGAALAAGILNDEVQDLDFFVATEHALGTIITEGNSGESRFSVLIGRNTKLPAKKTDGYSPVFDNQEVVNIRVIEGDPDLPLEHPDNVILKEWPVQLDPRPLAEAGFEITYEYDVDGILHVKVIGNDGRPMLDEQLSSGGAASKQELVEIRRRIDSLDTTTPSAEPHIGGSAPEPALDPESAAAVRRAKDKVMPFIDEVEQKRFEDLIDTLIAAGPDEVTEARGALDHAIRDHAYLL